MKHLIIGYGNLGKDIHRQLMCESTNDIHILSKSKGFDATDFNSLQNLLQYPFDIIWYCVGFGSVSEAEKYRQRAQAVHLHTPIAINQLAHHNTHVVFFSTDYAADETKPQSNSRFNPNPRSAYAELKCRMERSILAMNRPYTTIIRVGSLYGSFKPEQTFPGKVIRNFVGCPRDRRIVLPLNKVTPTSTLWLAGLVCEFFYNLFSDKGTTLHHCAPVGNVSVRDWAIEVLSPFISKGQFDSGGIWDDKRPQISELGCSFIERNWTWQEVWANYFDIRKFTPVDLQDYLPASIVDVEKHERLA